MLNITESPLEPQPDIVFDYCDMCGGEIYKGEEFYDIENQCICEDCLHDFADEYFESYRREAINEVSSYN